HAQGHARNHEQPSEPEEEEKVGAGARELLARLAARRRRDGGRGRPTAGALDRGPARLAALTMPSSRGTALVRYVRAAPPGSGLARRGLLGGGREGLRDGGACRS